MVGFDITAGKPKNTIIGNVAKGTANGNHTVWEPKSLRPYNAKPMVLPGRYTVDDPYVQGQFAEGKRAAKVYKDYERMVRLGVEPIDEAELKKEEEAKWLGKHST